MSRRSNGLVGVWAEMQRQQQRQVEADARRRRQEAQQARAHQRRAAQSHREYMQAEALRRTEELDAQVASLQGLLASGCQAPAFRASSLMRPEEVQPFAPGPLAQPVPMPNFDHYQAQSGWTAGRRAQAQVEARARFEQDWHAAQVAEAQRQQQLASYRREYQQWADAQLAEVRRHNAGVAELTEGVRRRDPDAWSSTSPPLSTPRPRGRKVSRVRWQRPTTRQRDSWCWTGSCPLAASSPRPNPFGTCTRRTSTRRVPGQ